MKNFLYHAKQVHAGLVDKYHDGEFTDPASVDPLAEKTPSWSD
jgi:hypothetical protein